MVSVSRDITFPIRCEEVGLRGPGIFVRLGHGEEMTLGVLCRPEGLDLRPPHHVVNIDTGRFEREDFER